MFVTRIRSEWVCIDTVLCSVLGRWRAVCWWWMADSFWAPASFFCQCSLHKLAQCTFLAPSFTFPPFCRCLIPLIVLIWIAFTRRVGWLCFTPREWKSTEVAFRELGNTSWAARDKWLFNASPAVTSSMSPCRLILIRVHQSPAVWSHIPISQRSRHVGVRYVRINELCVCLWWMGSIVIPQLKLCVRS